MRLHPAVAAVGRTAKQTDTLSGYHIPPETHIFCGIEAIQRCDKYWPDPESFKPERFDHLSKYCMAELAHNKKEHSDWFPGQSIFCYADR